jgi:hypothetical protein
MWPIGAWSVPRHDSDVAKRQFFEFGRALYWLPFFLERLYRRFKIAWPLFYVRKDAQMAQKTRALKTVGRYSAGGRVRLWSAAA